MPSMDLQHYEGINNVDLLNAIRSTASPLYQSRIPAATQSNISDVMNAMWDYTPARNEFVDALVNVIGATNVRWMSFTNPMAKFKQGSLQYGETVEEVYIGLLKAHEYVAEREALEADIFGSEPNEVQSRFHKVNRRNFYKLTINEAQLQRAFYNQNGLMGFVTGLMASLATSDQVDEFELMTSLFRRYYDRSGFFNINVPDLAALNADQDAAQLFLIAVRELQARLQFPSRAYNPARANMVTPGDRLELFMTPRAQAVVDVRALAAAFNLGLTEIAARTTIIPEENFNIPNTQAILTTRDFFQVFDTKMEMQQSNNPVKLHQNYFWHRWQVISASAFVPAIRFSTDPSDVIRLNTYDITGVPALKLTDEDGATVTVTGDAATIERGKFYVVEGSATTNPAGGSGAVVYTIDGRKSSGTRISQSGVLLVAMDDTATELVVTARAVDDESFSRTLTLTVDGPVITGSIGKAIDEDGNLATANA